MKYKNSIYSKLFKTTLFSKKSPFLVFLNVLYVDSSSKKELERYLQPYNLGIYFLQKKSSLPGPFMYSQFGNVLRGSIAIIYFKFSHSSVLRRSAQYPLEEIFTSLQSRFPQLLFLFYKVSQHFYSAKDLNIVTLSHFDYFVTRWLPQQSFIFSPIIILIQFFIINIYNNLMFFIYNGSNSNK